MMLESTNSQAFLNCFSMTNRPAYQNYISSHLHDQPSYHPWPQLQQEAHNTCEKVTIFLEGGDWEGEETWKSGEILFYQLLCSRTMVLKALSCQG